MKTSTINNDIYKLSETLYGADRFKLVIEAMRINDQKGDFNKAHLPKICTIFDTLEECEDYSKMILDFYVMNYAVFP